MSERVLSSVMMSVVVCIDRLSFQTGYGVKFLDGSGTETCECSKDRSLDFCYLRILDCIGESILGLGRMILEFLRSVFLTKGRYLVEVHFKIVCHLFREGILRPPHSRLHRREYL